MLTNPTPLHCLIISAGIAGLTATLALLRSGHHITILEKSHYLTETGAALGLGPNASSLPIDLGWDRASSGAIAVRGLTSIDGETGEPRAQMDLEEFAKRWKSPWLSVHGVDLHRELRKLGESAEGLGREGELVLGAWGEGCGC